MPVQKECYGGHSWEEEIVLIKEKLHFADDCYLANSNDYQRPLILLSKDEIGDSLRKKLKKSSKRIYAPSIFDKLVNDFCQIVRAFLRYDR